MPSDFQNQPPSNSVEDNKSNGGSPSVSEAEMVHAGYGSPMTHAQRWEFFQNSELGRRLGVVQKLEQTDSGTTPIFQISLSADGFYHWRLLAQNGQVLASSPESGYQNRMDCEQALQSVKQYAAASPVEVLG